MLRLVLMVFYLHNLVWVFFQSNLHVNHGRIIHTTWSSVFQYRVSLIPKWSVILLQDWDSICDTAIDTAIPLQFFPQRCALWQAWRCKQQFFSLKNRTEHHVQWRSISPLPMQTRGNTFLCVNGCHQSNCPLAQSSRLALPWSLFMCDLYLIKCNNAIQWQRVKCSMCLCHTSF